MDEYVQNFRYVPPSDPEEITMRGETPVLEPERFAAVEHSVSPRIRSPVWRRRPPLPKQRLLPAADDVRERLGLEVDSTAEQRSDRPRFLDFNEPPAPPETSGASATPIAGPSFLGLSDAPQAQAETADELGVEEPAHGKWRIWLATAVVLVFGFLGVLEWRAQVRQTNNGPVEVIKMKMRSLTHSKPAENASTESASPATPADSASKPEMQVEPSSQPQNQNPAANTATSAATKDVASVPNTNAATTPLASSATVTPAPTGNQPRQPDRPLPRPRRMPAPNFCWAEYASGENHDHNRPRGQIEIDCVTAVRVGRHAHR